jgi:serine phosphatase RsbU (regulator of sigma subunit)/PAS domain-containing protein
VPRFADLCVIDLLDDDGTIAEVAVAATDPQLAGELASIRAAHPLDRAGEHPAAQVIRNGRPELLSQMRETLLRSFATGSEHARFMIEHGYHSAAVAPLLARGRTLGALSVLRLGASAPLAPDDLELAAELARRAAVAIDNARLFVEVRGVEQRLEALLANIAEAITLFDRSGRIVYANRAAAELLGADGPQELIDADQGTVMSRFLVTDEHGRALSSEQMPSRRLFAGETPEPLPGETLRQIARLAVPQLAEWCAVDVLDEDNRIERVAVHHSDPDRLALAAAIDSRYHPSITDPVGVPEVIRTGRPRIYREIDAAALAAYARDEAHLELLRGLDAGSIIIVPLAAPARTLGAITLVCSRTGRRLTEADLGVAVRLGRRAGTAVESARLFTERTRIARVLEAALLPETLPAIPGVQVAARYRAAGELNEVGGDFYDVIHYDEQRWLLIIGDVWGKGPRAAGVTALARHTLAAAAMFEQPPVEMLATLNKALRRLPARTELCTVCLATIEPGLDSTRVSVALAGHPPALRIDAAGRCAPVGIPGTALGVVEPIRVEQVELELGPGETLLLYTDGLPEAGRRERHLDEQQLAAVCAAAAGAGLEEMLDQLEQGAIERAGGRMRDDIALLALRPSGTSPTPEAPTPEPV